MATITDPSRLLTYSTYMLPDSAVAFRFFPVKPEPSYVINIYEDLAPPAKPYMKRPNWQDNIFEIHVPKKEADLEAPNGKGALLACWLHELGHIIAGIFNLPANRYDLRNFHYLANGDLRARMYDSEVEAWDVGEAIYRFHLMKRQCLESYRDRSNDPLWFNFKTDDQVKR